MFACGGYFNLMPWIMQKMSARAQRREEEGANRGRNGGLERDSEGVSHDFELDRIPSSTSVFRTPSSAASESQVADSAIG